VKYILERAEYYGFSGQRVKGLIFCSRKEEARELSEKFNATGRYNTVMLSGDDSQEDREDAIERLVSDTRIDKLDYIFTVDIFNEGVDVPEINQVILLRPTESPIIFVQQL
jgi:superfamily II DNA or RNA helicase